MYSEDLPQSQREVYEYLLGLRPEDPAPTLRELGKKFGVVQSGIQCRLNSLRAKGLVTWVDGQARTLQAIRPGCQWVSVPDRQLPLVEAVLDPSPATVATVEQWVSSWRKQQRVAAAEGYNPAEVPL